MKKLITTCCIIGAFASVAHAQIKLGLKLAPQITWVAPESKGISTDGIKLNAAYGLMFDYYFTENYAFGTEVTMAAFAGNLAIENSTLTKNGATSPIGKVDYTFKTQYINIPLMLRMRTNEIGYLRYFAEFGLDLGVLTRAKANVSSNNISITDVNVNNPEKEDEYTIESNDNPPVKYDDDVVFIRTGMIIGAGIQYNIFGNTQLVAGVRYNSALNNFTAEDNWKARMNAVCLNLGVLF